MDNQHRKIKGYRELSQAEVDLMNRIKTKGAELLDLQAELVDLLKLQEVSKKTAIDQAQEAISEAETQDELDRYHATKAEFNRFYAAEPFRWAAIGKTDIQTGIMALVRAVAQPAGV